MIFKIKGFFLLIFLILLQSCSGGKIGNFLESSFENLEKRNKMDDLKNSFESKKVLDVQTKENNENTKNKVKPKLKIFSDSNRVIDVKKKENNKLNLTEIKKVSNANNFVRQERKSNIEKQLVKTKIKNKNKSKGELKSYKIIFILKDVDPKDPIEELSTILRNSDLNFQIEKIELFLGPKNINTIRN